MMFIAQLSPPAAPESIGWIVLVIAALCAALNQGWGLVNRFRGKYASEELEKRISILEIDATHGRGQRQQLAEKVEKLLVAVGKLEQNDETQTAQLARIESVMRQRL